VKDLTENEVEHL